MILFQTPAGKITKSLVFAAFFGLTISSHAAALLYWEADGNTNNSVAGGAALNGTASGWNGTAVSGTGAPTYSSSVPGTIITAGVGGAVVNGANTSSFSFVNPALAGGTKTSTVGGIVTTSGTTLQLQSFTAEAFVKTSSAAEYATIFNLSNSIGVSWMLDTNGDASQLDKLRLRTDTTLGTNKNANSGGSMNMAITNDAWHHVAVTYSAGLFSVYLDYNLVITAFDPAGDVRYDANSTFNVGGGSGRAFNGLIDEVRFSDTVLSSNDFLRAIPEPSAALLGALGLLGLLRRRRA